MSDPIDAIRRLIDSPADAVRWACLLEATAPKAGNVYPGKPFEDLTYQDFVAAAEIASEHLGQTSLSMSRRMLETVQQTVSTVGTNVNLGIVLLLGPLVAADENRIESLAAGDGPLEWSRSIQSATRDLDQRDGQRLYQMIQVAEAGGLGTAKSMDVRDRNGPIDIIKAMALADSYDRIARQYTSGFADLLENVVPIVRESIVQRGDVLSGISVAHLQLLRGEPDSLIGRKNGPEVANEVQRRAREVDLESAESIAHFDQTLRSHDHALNPGTTADLIAAALYLLLRE